MSFTMDFSQCTPGEQAPSQVTACVGQQSAVIPTAGKISFPSAVPAGNYCVKLYSQADKITVSGSTASVETTAGVADHAPGCLFTWHHDITVVGGQNYDLAATMRQQVRDLSFTLTVTEGDPARITGIEAELTGVAGAIDIETNAAVGSAVKVAPVFILNDDKISATVRLLDVQGSSQMLKIVFTFADGSVRSQTIDSDISAELSGFNTDKKTPLSYSADIITPVGAAVTATITEWERTSNDIELI